MFKVPIAFICVIFTTQNAYAASISPYFSTAQKRVSFSILGKDYEDVRIDGNLDGKIDRWNIKKGNTEISVKSFPGRDIYHIKRFSNGAVEERILAVKDQRVYLLYSQNRKMRVYYQSVFANVCRTDHETAWEKLKKSFSAIEASTLDICSENYLDKSCQIKGIYEKIQDVVKEMYTPPSAEEPNTFLSCLESEDSKSIFQKRLGPKEGNESYIQTLVNYKNRIINFVNSSDGKSPATIGCKVTKEPGEKPKSLENGQMQIIVNTDKIGSAGKSAEYDLRSQTFHETIHTSKVEDEVLTTALTRLCVNKETNISVEPLPERYKGVTPVNGDQAAHTASLKASDAIPASIAEAPKPLPPSGSPQEMNRVAEALGTEQTMKISRSQTSSVIRMAENVLSASPAVAAPPTANLASSSKASSNSRLPASEPSTNSVKATNAASKNLRSGAKSKAREYVTEEIDLTKQVVMTSGSTVTNRAEQSLKSNQSVAADISVPPSSEVVHAASGSASAGGSSRGFDSRSGPASNRTVNSRASNRNVASTANGNPVERVEVIRTITKGSYKETQAQLQSPAFQEKLKNNGIRIYNLKGGDFGARDARTVFLDTGATFVLEE